MSKAINPMLLCDFYKTVHSDMINPKMTKSMSYYTPRMSRVKRWDKVVMFGVQMFCKTWLIDYFNKNFFELSEEEVDGKCYPVFKTPKEGGFKKSQKGLCYVYEEDGELKYKDEYTSENIPEGNLLETVFKDGKMIKDYTLNEIRQRLNGGEF